jgi:hypothetical protein
LSRDNKNRDTEGGKGANTSAGRDMKELGDKGNQKVENFGISA